LYGSLLTVQLVELKFVNEVIDGEFVWTSDCESCLNPLEDLLPTGEHVANITFEPSDQVNYVQVQKFPLSIYCVESLEFAYGLIFTEDTLQVKNLKNSVEAFFEYYQDNGESIEVNGMIFNAGQHILRVVYAPKEPSFYLPAEKIVTLTVHKYESKMTLFSALELINLDITAMNGISEYSGSETDTSPLGVVFPVGHYQILVRFFLTDAANFSVTCIETVQISYRTLVTPELLEVRLVTDDIIGEYLYTSDCPDCLNPLIELLPAGHHTITVTFQTSDNINYIPAQRQIILQVDPC
jgi:hypothetical protein